MDKAYNFNAKAKAWLSLESKAIDLTIENEKINELQSDCILCGSCYSACPVYAVNGEFLGPFSLTRVWKYTSDAREINEKEKIDTIQTNGIWDCTLCNECTLVCPQGISSKSDIEKLRSKSAIAGYSDPNFASFGGGFGFDGSPSF
jgi:fumarate reductase iron-sulfur subunit